MANRFLVSGAQLGMILGSISTLEDPNGKVKPALERLINKIIDTQHVSESMNSIQHDCAGLRQAMKILEQIEVRR